MTFTRKKNDRTKYGLRNVPDNCLTRFVDGEIGICVVVLFANLSSSDPIINTESTSTIVGLNEDRGLESGIRWMDAPDDPQTENIGLPQLELLL
jgi:hypothetical protein